MVLVDDWLIDDNWIVGDGDVVVVVVVEVVVVVSNSGGIGGSSCRWLFTGGDGSVGRCCESGI